MDAFLTPKPGTVSLGGEIGERVERTIEHNIRLLDFDRDFFTPFREKSATGGFIGLGKLIDASAHLAAYSRPHTSAGSAFVSEHRERVARTIELQGSDGYLGMFESSHRIWELWDIHEMAFIVTGLVSNDRFDGTGLEEAMRLATHLIDAIDADPGRTPRIGEFGSISRELSFLGLEEALVSLYGRTGEQKLLDFLERFGLFDWDLPIVKGRYGTVEGHAYAYLCKSLAQLRLYRLTEDERLLGPTRRAIEFLLEEGGLTVTGGISHYECWHDTQDGSAGLGESCAETYLVFVLDELLRIEGRSIYGDVMERVLYNALFAAQSPSGREIRYYTPFEGRRSYWGVDTYCCPNNFRRAVSRLPDFVFYRTEAGVAINLYTDSSMTHTLESGTTMTLTQRTRYPTDGRISISVDVESPVRFELRLRIPAWAAAARVTVAGSSASPSAGTFHRIDREWSSGDTVELELPIDSRFIAGTAAQSGRAAVLRGPRVYTLARSRSRDHDRILDADLSRIVIDPESLGEVEQHDALRPDGTGIALRCWSPGHHYVEPPNTRIHLTEFPDPDGEASYFRIPDPDASFLESDELTRR